MLTPKEIIALPKRFKMTDAQFIMAVNLKLLRDDPRAKGFSQGTFYKWRREDNPVAKTDLLERVTLAIQEMRAEQKRERQEARLLNRPSRL